VTVDFFSVRKTAAVAAVGGAPARRLGGGVGAAGGRRCRRRGARHPRAADGTSAQEEPVRERHAPAAAHALHARRRRRLENEVNTNNVNTVEEQVRLGGQGGCTLSRETDGKVIRNQGSCT